MLKSKVERKSAITMVAIFVFMLVMQSCGGSKYGCPNEITKVKDKQEVRS